MHIYLRCVNTLNNYLTLSQHDQLHRSSEKCTTKYSFNFRSLDGVTGGDEYELTGDDTEYHSDHLTKQNRQV